MTEREQMLSYIKQVLPWIGYVANQDHNATNRANAREILTELEDFHAAASALSSQHLSGDQNG